MPRPVGATGAGAGSAPRPLNKLVAQDHAEKEFWKHFEIKQKSMQDAAERKYQKAARNIRADVDAADDHQSTTTNDGDKPPKHPNTTQTPSHSTTPSTHTSKAARLVDLELDFRKKDQERLEKKRRVKNLMTRWFQQKRAEIISSNPILTPTAGSWYPSPDDVAMPDAAHVGGTGENDAMSDDSMPDWPAAKPTYKAKPHVAKSTNTHRGKPSKPGKVTSNSDRITKANLLVKHNGKVYTAPRCIVGVPVEKIYPGHPYWDNSWPDQRGVINETLSSYRAKLEAGMKAVKSRTADFQGKAQLQQQVTRGETNLDFIENGPICMYQLLAKQYINPGGRASLVSNANMYRLCITLQELQSFGIDIKPIDWLRQRLQEIMDEEGHKFNLSRVIGKFYQDPKLVQLRSDAGFRNTGRPAVHKTMVYNTKLKPSRHSRVSKDEQDSLKSTKVFSSPRRARMSRTAAEPLPYEELFNEEDVLTDTDSFTGESLKDTDWRIYQVKTRIHTSSNQMTQYWEWVAATRVFEHQVIRETEPVVQWGLLRDPLDFEVCANEIISVSWNIESLRAHFSMTEKRISTHDNKPRGDLLVAFKRPGTMRRFLRFCSAEGIPITKESEADINSRWDALESLDPDLVDQTDGDSSPSTSRD